ncbi:lipocalin family protein [Bernardetia sp. OM2101]|uniref:lipocalin family protein n=1 Tax=Bernardetia sp. OM2101 TaxID=3344876 RepID=UPI0035CE8942
MSNRFVFYFLAFILFSFVLSSCGDKKDDPTPKELPDRPVVTWQNAPSADRIFYTDESVVLQATKTGGYIEELEWKINGTIVTNPQEIIINEDSTLISLSHPFDAPGRYDVSLRVANEGGESTIIQVLNFEVRPIPPLDLLAGQVSKTWRFTSIKLNDGPELINDYEEDNTLQFFRENQTDGTYTFNCVFDKGTLTNGEANSNGRWKFIFNERYIEFSRINVFPNNASIIELTETEMTLGRSEGDSEIIYKLILVQ